MSEPPDSPTRRGSRASTRPGRRRRSSSASYAERLPVGRAERDLLPAALRGAAARLGRADAAGLPLRREDEPAGDALRRPLGRRHLLRARARARRPARPDPRPAAADPAARRRLARADARLARPRARVRVRVPERVLGRRRGGPARQLARGRRAVPLPAPARAALRRGRAARLGRAAAAAARRRHRGLRVLQARGRADRAGVRAAPRVLAASPGIPSTVGSRRRTFIYLGRS